MNNRIDNYVNLKMGIITYPLEKIPHKKCQWPIFCLKKNLIMLFYCNFDIKVTILEYGHGKTHIEETIVPCNEEFSNLIA